MDASSSLESIFKKSVADVLGQTPTKKRAGKTGPLSRYSLPQEDCFILELLRIDWPLRPN